ncbi:MAG: type II toxin-antitoxin system HicA family toxin [Rhodospirillales bacterium]|nr:type II toxin-antitoxin system HicA family toxin [Rhodospirillales bacterium]
MHHRGLGGRRLKGYPWPRPCRVPGRRAWDSRQLIRNLEQDGWYRVAQRGSHVQFKHPAKPGRVTVPHPKKDIPVGTLKSIARQAGLNF